MENENQPIRREQVRVDNPCHEDWDNMSPSEQGRFCGVCQTEVVDFVSMSDQDFIAFFQNYQGQKVCGRVAQPIETPVPKVLTAKIVQRKSWRALAAASLLAASLLACNNNHQAVVEEYGTVRVGKIAQTIENPIGDLLKGDGLRGTIQKNGNKIAYSSVQLYNGNELLTEMQTKEGGEFQLKYPQYDPSKHQNLIIRAEHMEYETASKNINATTPLDSPLTIELGAPTHRKGKIKVK
jgi:hypothetical protein